VTIVLLEYPLHATQITAIGLCGGEELGRSSEPSKPDDLYAPCEVPWPSDLPAPPYFCRISLAQQGSAPCTREAKTALQVAGSLCNTMGTYFEHENARRDAFLRTIHPLFSRWITTEEVASQGVKVSTRTDVTLSVNGITMALTEIKNGKKGDAYMQANRGYEVITKALAEKNPKFLARGAPTFISCLNG